MKKALSLLLAGALCLGLLAGCGQTAPSSTVSTGSSASTEPMKEPNSDILMVSNRGSHIWDIYSHLGGIIWPRMTKNSPIRLTRTPRSKPVTSTDTTAMASSAAA